MSLLEPDAVDAAIASSPWRREGGELVLTSKRESFAGAVAFVNEVARLAEEANHHPDIDIRWDTVTLRLFTHSEGGLTSKDVDLALRIAELG